MRSAHTHAHTTARSLHEQSKKEENTNPIADLQMKRRCQKIKAAAGIIHMAKFVAKA